MRQLATAARIRAFLAAMGRAASEPTTAFLTGGSTAVLLGWRDSTIDIVVKFVPDSAVILHAIPAMKDALEINVELASPDMFIPVPPGWEDRSPWETSEGRLTVRHFDLTAQAMAKLERGHARDLDDVQAMLDRGLVSPGWPENLPGADRARAVPIPSRQPRHSAPGGGRAGLGLMSLTACPPPDCWNIATISKNLLTVERLFAYTDDQ